MWKELRREGKPETGCNITDIVHLFYFKKQINKKGKLSERNGPYSPCGGKNDVSVCFR